jgi:HEAT repeat protein
MWETHKSFVLAATLVALFAGRAFAQEAELLAVVKSNAGVQEKSDACRKLARVATKDAVPALAALLGDEKLSHMARYALESIRDPSVDEALRDALGKVQGSPRLGVIGSLGARRDAKSVEPLGAIVKGSDAAAAQAAARALGCIGSAPAAQALQDSLKGAAGPTQLAVCEGLFRCAETMTAADQADAARAIYDGLRGQADMPPQVKAAALRGAILSRKADGIPLLLEAIRGTDHDLANTAVRTAMELSGKEVADALVAELPKVSPERQGLVINALAIHGEAQVLPAVLKAAQSPDAQLRVLAIRTLKRVGDASCVPALLDAAAEGNGEVSPAALESLENLQGQAVDDQVVERLSKAEGKVRLLLIGLVAKRRTAAAAPALWTAADD